MSAGGGMSKSSGSSSSSPWKGLQPHLQNLYSGAQQATQDPNNLNLYGGSRVADEDPRMAEYRGMVTDQVRAGDPNLAAGSAYNQDVLGSQFIGQNPHTNPALMADLQDVKRSYMEGVGQVHGGFEGAGRAGSFLHGRTLGEADRTYAQESQNAFDRRSFADYQQERGYQQQASAQAPGYAEANYGEMAQLGGVAQDAGAYEQQLLDDLVAKFEYYQQLPVERQSQYAQLLGTTGAMQSASNNSSRAFNFSLCWASAAHYGWYTPSWFDCRAWISEGWPAESELGVAFLHLYRAHGQAFAKRIRESEDVRELSAPFFRWAQVMGRVWRGQ
jgi:hypothetical protein